MPPFLIVLGAIALVGVVLRARPLAVLGVYAAAAVAIPGSLAVPFTGVSYLTVQHVLVVAGLGRVLLGLLDGSLPASALRPTRVHAALGALLVVSFAVGVLATTTTDDPIAHSLSRLTDLADQLGFFVVCLALIRQVAELRKVLVVGGCAVVLGGVIAVVERVTGASWGEYLFSELPSQRPTTAAFPLGARDGSLRVRAGAEFALQFGWLVVTLLPALVASSLTWPGRSTRFRLLFAGAVGTFAVLAVYWSFARTALAAALAVLAVTALLSRQRVLVLAASGALTLVALLYFTAPAVARHVDVSADAGSIDARVLRLAPVMDVVSEHPFQGLGLGGLLKSGFRVSDNAFLLHYIELGAIGVVALVLVLTVALTESARPLRLTAPEDRLLGAAAFAGVLAYLASAMAYDAFTLIQGVHLLWWLVAFAVVLGERRLGPRVGRPAGHLLLRIAAGGLTGLAAGLLVFAFAPLHTGQRLLLTTLPVAVEVSPGDAVVDGVRAINTVCGTLVALDLDRVDLDCTDLKTASGLARLRVAAPDRTTLDLAVASYASAITATANLPQARLFPLDEPRTGRSSVTRTAPVWIPLALMGLIALLPGPSRPRPGPPQHARPAPVYSSNVTIRREAARTGA